MPRYTTTIEFDSIARNTNGVEYDLKQYLSQYENLNIKSVTKITISPEEALTQIRGMIWNSTAVSSEALNVILNRVG
jgi:hypothetical protein